MGSKVKNKTAADKYLERKEKALKDTEARMLSIVKGYSEREQELIKNCFEIENELKKMKAEMFEKDKLILEISGMNKEEVSDYIATKIKAGKAMSGLGSLMQMFSAGGLNV